MSDTPKPCSICGEAPVRADDKMICEPCYTRINGVYQQQLIPSVD